MNKTYTFEEAIELWKKLTEKERSIMRHIASRRLVWQGFNEVGSSDINHEIHQICNEYDGDYRAIMDEYLEDFLRGYKSLA
jgi:hypothetical protein